MNEWTTYSEGGYQKPDASQLKEVWFQFSVWMNAMLYVFVFVYLQSLKQGDRFYCTSWNMS